jgi:hypothetical protein
LTSQNFKSNSKDWDNFGNHVQDLVAELLRCLPDASLARDDIRQQFKKLSKCVNQSLMLSLLKFGSSFALTAHWRRLAKRSKSFKANPSVNEFWPT